MALEITANTQRLQHASGVPTTGDITVCGLWRVDDTPSTYAGILAMYGSGIEMLIAKNNGTGGSPSYYTEIGGGGTSQTLGAAISGGEWHGVSYSREDLATDQHIIRVFDDDGRQDTSRTSNSNITLNATLRFGDSLTYSNEDGHRSCNWKIYTAVLSQDEIEQELRQFVPVRTADLWAWHPMIGSTTAQTSRDWSGNGRTLTETGTTSVGDGPPIPWDRAILILPTPSAPAPSALTIDVNDTVTVADVDTVGVNLGISEEETVSVSEATAVGLEIIISEAETVTVADVDTVGLNLGISEEETVTVTDVDTVTINAATDVDIDVNDTVSVADADQVAVTPQIISEAETVTVTDATANVAVTPTIINVSDAVTVTDVDTVTLANVGTLQPSVAETVTVTDVDQVAVTPFIITVSDAVTVTDVDQAAVTPTIINESEVVTVTDVDTVVLSQDVNPSVSDAVTVTDVETVVVETVRLTMDVNDAVTVTDVDTVVIPLLVVDVAETVTVTDGDQVAVTPLLVSEFEGVTVTDVDTMRVGSPLPPILHTRNVSQVPTRRNVSQVARRRNVAISE